jgi:L-lactate dehydrogenase
MGEWKERKVVIVGAGAVGATFAYALAQSGIADDIVLLDQNQELAKGQVLDLEDGLPFLPTIKIREGSQADYRDAHVIVITAGSKQQSGESRLTLLKRNITIIEHIAQDIAAQKSQAVIIVVSNPVDVLTYAALKKIDWPRERVIGSGTFLDSARFRYLLSKHCGIDVHNVHAYILGEHGDTEFAAWSMAHIAGMPIDRYCFLCKKCADCEKERQKIANEVRDSAYHIIEYKGSTYFAIGLALVQIVAAIIRNQHSVLTVSTFLNGEYGLHDVCTSVPCILSQHGVEQIIEGSLTEDELQALTHSADVLRKTFEELHEEYYPEYYI